MLVNLFDMFRIHQKIIKVENENLPPFVYAEMNQEVRLILSAFLNFSIVNNCKHLLDNDIGVPNG